MDKCAVCHQENGLGLKNEDSTGAYYLYPPLWGDDSYNTGTGMYRLIKAASYIKENMPQGAPDLSLEDAYDVAAYMNSQARPIKANKNKDFQIERLSLQIWMQDLMMIAFLQPNIAMDLIQI